MICDSSRAKGARARGRRFLLSVLGLDRPGLFAATAASLTNSIQAASGFGGRIMGVVQGFPQVSIAGAAFPRTRTGNNGLTSGGFFSSARIGTAIATATAAMLVVSFSGFNVASNPLA
jgi:hypothetical protein